MTTKNPDWDHIRVFLALARTGSLRAAAQELGVSQPTLGRHLSALETAVGVVLFDRLPEGLRMTEAGRDLRPRAEAMEEAAFAFHRQGDAISGIRDRFCRASWFAPDRGFHHQTVGNCFLCGLCRAGFGRRHARHGPRCGVCRCPVDLLVRGI